MATRHHGARGRTPCGGVHLIHCAPGPCLQGTTDTQHALTHVLFFSIVFQTAWSESEVDALLHWFATASTQDTAWSATLCFPRSLTKDDRARVKAAANKAGLPALSQGIGDDRHIRVCTHAAAVALEGGGGGGQRPQQRHSSAALVALPSSVTLDEALKLARSIRGCETTSRGELEEMLRLTAMPPELRGKLDALHRARQEATLLVIAARRGDAETLRMAVEAADSPCALLCRADPQSGETPLHAACRQNNVELLRWMLSVERGAPALVDAVDGKGRSLLEVARRADACEVEALLLGAGAMDTAPCAIADFSKASLWPKAAQLAAGSLE